MAEKRQVCTCSKCGNEAEMIVTCEWVQVEGAPEGAARKQKETRTCTICGNEANLIVNL